MNLDTLLSTLINKIKPNIRPFGQNQLHPSTIEAIEKTIHEFLPLISSHFDSYREIAQILELSMPKTRGLVDLYDPAFDKQQQKMAKEVGWLDDAPLPITKKKKRLLERMINTHEHSIQYMAGMVGVSRQSMLNWAHEYGFYEKRYEKLGGLNLSAKRKESRRLGKEMYGRIMLYLAYNEGWAMGAAEEYVQSRKHDTCVNLSRRQVARGLRLYEKAMNSCQKLSYKETGEAIGVGSSQARRVIKSVGKGSLYREMDYKKRS